MELGLNEFLSQLGKDTVSRLDREHKTKEIKKTPIVKEEKRVEMPTQRVEKPKPQIEEKHEQNEELNEDFLEEALDYANVVVKTVRKGFDTAKQRRKVFESIRSAIDIYLGDYSPKQYSHQQAQPNTSQPTEIHMKDFTNQPVDIQPQKPHGIMENKLNIGVKVGHDGKQQADLSGLTQEDYQSLRVLSGIEEAPKK